MFQHPSHRVPSQTSKSKGEEEQQETENLSEKIIKGDSPNLAKEIDFQKVQEAQSPKEVGSKETLTKAHHNYITQDSR